MIEKKIIHGPKAWFLKTAIINNMFDQHKVASSVALSSNKLSIMSFLAVGSSVNDMLVVVVSWTGISIVDDSS